MRGSLSPPLALFFSALCTLTGFFVLIFGYWGVLFYDLGFSEDYLTAMGIVFGILAVLWIVFLRIRRRKSTQA